jgi:hypothetical protein
VPAPVEDEQPQSPDDEELSFEESLREKGLSETEFGRREASAEAETPSTDEPETTEETDTSETEPETEERERDEQGRFVAKKAEAEKEAEELDTSDLDDDVKAYLAKYGGDLKAALRGAAEAQSLIGKHGLEIGELRKELESLTSSLVDEDVPLDAGTLSWFGQQVENNPQAAVMWALQNAPALYPQAMEAWIDAEPYQAISLHTRLAVAQAQNEIRDEMAPVADETQTQQFHRAWAEVARAHPDLNKLEQQIVEAAQSSPAIVRELQTGTAESKKAVLEQLYYLAKGRSAETLAAAAQEIAQETQEASRQAKKEATVASASSRPASRGEKTNVDRFKEALLETPSTSVSAGLTDK